jgi:hypothetical protein
MFTQSHHFSLSGTKTKTALQCFLLKGQVLDFGKQGSDLVGIIFRHLKHHLVE